MSPLDINPVFQSLGGEMINQKIAAECLDNLILNAINTIRKKKNKKRPYASSIYEFICIIDVCIVHMYYRK